MRKGIFTKWKSKIIIEKIIENSQIIIIKSKKLKLLVRTYNNISN